MENREFGGELRIMRNRGEEGVRMLVSERWVQF